MGGELWWLQQLLGLLVAAAAALLLLHQRSSSRQRLKLPPGPRGLPVLGNLFLFVRAKLWHADFYKLAETYGPIMWLRLGSQGVVMVQSPEMAREILKTQDNIFASRPRLSYGGRIIFSNGQNVGFVPYGPVWRVMRKLMTMELLTQKRMTDFQHVRLEEVGYMVEAIRSHLGQPVDLDYLFTCLNLNNITRMGFGKSAVSRYRVQDPQHNPQHKASSAITQKEGAAEEDEDELIGMIREAARIMGLRGIGDAIPWLSFVDSYFLFPEAKLLRTKRQLDAYYGKVIQEHRQYRASHPGSPPRDFVDVLVSVSSSESDHGVPGITDDVITEELQELILAGVETVGATMVWAMAELLRNPDDMERAVQELDRVVGASRAVTEADVANLPFLQAVVKETFRLHPPAVFLVPHYSMQAATVGGYHIPADTAVFINAWALGRDPAYWPNPDRFQPGRFLGATPQADVDLKGHHFQLLPFGAGKRVCPGISVGVGIVQLAVATLLHSFTWTLPPDVARPEDLDMTERQGLVVHKNVRLKAVPHPKRTLTT